MDNARVHSIPDMGEYAWEHFQVIVLFLPPYSPDLNPIERLFAYCKSVFKRLVGSQPQLRQSPFILWLLSLSLAATRIDFHSLISSTYRLNHHSQNVGVQYF